MMSWYHFRSYIPTFSQLFKSLKLRSKEYLRENTLHGFIYFVNPCRPIWERGIWLFCTIASFCMALGIIATIWQRFQSTPTLIDLDIDTEDITNIYPSIHLCMTSDHFDMKDTSKDLANIYEIYYNWNWKQLNHTEIKLSVTLSNAFQHLTPNCSSLLMDCTEKGVATDCAQLFIKTLTPAGICCKSTSKKYTRYQDPPNLSFTLRERKILNMYIHNIDESPLRHSPISYVLNRNIGINLDLYQTEADDGLRMLSKTQRECIFSDEGLSYNECHRECMRKSSLKICKCIPWFEVNAGHTKECDLHQYLCFLNNVKPTDCIDDCYIFCNHTEYLFETIKNNKTTSITTRWPPVRYKRKIRFGWLDLIVSFGGIMGLFLGYSILTTVELIYYFSLRLYCGALMDNNNIDGVKKIRVAERKKPQVIKIKYYDYIE